MRRPRAASGCLLLGSLTLGGCPARLPAPAAGLRVAAAGDLQLGARTEPAQLAALQTLLDGDLRLCNLEGPITARGHEAGLDGEGRPLGGPVRFAAPPDRAAGLAGRLDAVSLANNHALDQGELGRDDTLGVLARAGLAAAFAGNDARLERRGRRLVVIARELGTLVGAAEADELAQAVVAARGGGVVLVSLHWGRDGSLLPTPAQRTLGRRLIDAGATAILGHGPHTLQGIERHRGGLIAYSLGNLLFSCRCTEVSDALVLRFAIDAQGCASAIEAVPLYAGLAGRAPRAADDPDLRQLIAELSRDLGSEARIGARSVFIR
jgi:poly-gamma-glutamate synthesis protein (capsule biosynthesis protein)